MGRLCGMKANKAEKKIKEYIQDKSKPIFWFEIL
jgi:hypothetical protein